MPQRPEPTPDDREAQAAPLRWDALVRGLLVYARRLGASVEAAEDLVHGTVEVALRDPSWYDASRARLMTVLKVVLRRRYIDRYRSDEAWRRTEPHLRLVDASGTPAAVVEADEAASRRRTFLSLLTPDERSLFRAWLLQRRRDLDGEAAAASVGLSPAAYEAAKKRLRRRCHALLDDLGFAPDDLFDPDDGGAP